MPAIHPQHHHITTTIPHDPSLHLRHHRYVIDLPPQYAPSAFPRHATHHLPSTSYSPHHRAELAFGTTLLVAYGFLGLTIYDTYAEQANRRMEIMELRDRNIRENELRHRKIALDEARFRFEQQRKWVEGR